MPLGRLIDVSRPYRARYGQIAGFYLWFNLRRHLYAAPGMLHKVWVPGLAHPVFLRAQTSDVIVFTQIFVEEELGFDIPKLPVSIVDAGANIGLASLFFARRFPNARIIALEVEKSNFELLKLNTKHYPNITCIQKALWSSPKRLKIVNPHDEPWAFRVNETTENDSESEVTSLGVSELTEEFHDSHIDLLKIDIEGAEKEVFLHGSEKWLDRIDTIAVELHDRVAPGCRQALDDALKGRKYSMHQSGEYTVVSLAS